MIETFSTTMSAKPSQPASAVAKELRAALHDPNLNLDHIVELIASEPALAAEVLRRGNSVRFGGKEPATDVFAAVARIGTNGAYSALAAVSV
jgi:HD-like signal output (HDOD) protein